MRNSLIRCVALMRDVAGDIAKDYPGLARDITETLDSIRLADLLAADRSATTEHHLRVCSVLSEADFACSLPRGHLCDHIAINGANGEEVDRWPRPSSPAAPECRHVGRLLGGPDGVRCDVCGAFWREDGQDWDLGGQR
jgi:hypothetical protein